MKYTLLYVFMLIGLTAWTQVPSDCTIPETLQENYDRDVKSLALKRLQMQNGSDNELIEIPALIQDSIMEGMAAIFNISDSMFEADSVFNRYCVHDNFGSPALYGFIIGVDTDSPIAQAWESGSTLTGNAILDNLLDTYNFTLTSYISIGAGVLYTDQIINLFALADSITANVPGVLYGEPDYIIGNAGRISYDVDQNNNRFYEFRYEWNDCFDGCDNFYSWFFTVTPDCEVIFTGTDEGGFFGIEDLPLPVDCQITTSIDEVSVYTDFLLYPNPTSSMLSWVSAPTNGYWQVFNTQGKLMRKGKWGANYLDISTWPSGTYWFCGYEENGSLMIRRALVKQ